MFCIFFSRHGDTELPEVLDQIEEVILASHGLQEVSRTVKDLVNFVQANQRTTVCLSDNQAASVKAAFACIICGGTVCNMLLLFTMKAHRNTEIYSYLYCFQW